MRKLPIDAKHVVRALMPSLFVGVLMLLLLKPPAEGQKIVTRPTATPTPKGTPEPKSTNTPKPTPVITSNGIEFVRIPADEFVIGSATRANHEKPVQLVRISYGFAMGKYEVT
jgi:formylglycine-generating enzyme required for sulfatase activity